MPESYEQATENEAAQDDSDPGPEEELRTNMNVKTAEDVFDDVKSRVEAVPDFLKPESDGRTIERPDPGGRRGGLGVDIDFGDLSGLDNSGLLEVIARVNIAQLAALFDIADAVEPFNSITVSGVNAIDDADVEEPVVPESDEEQIPTRSLFIRASDDNNDKIYIGDDEVQPNAGYVLNQGEFIVLETDLRSEELYMASETAGQQVQLLGVV